MGSKYIAIYNGMVFPFDDIKDFAIKVLGYKIIKNERGAYDIIINGKEFCHYSDEWTISEIEKDLFCNKYNPFLIRVTYKNLQYYKNING